MILNKHHYGGRVPPGSVDIMRGTPFGNPYRITPTQTRDAVIARFRVYLWRRIQTDAAFAEQVRAIHGRDLCCCCAPLPCHGEVLERASAWLANQPACDPG